MILTKPFNACKGLYIKRLAVILLNSLATLKNGWLGQYPPGPAAYTIKAYE